MILAVDPSATCTGYAIMQSAELPGGVVEAGLIKPDRSADQYIDRTKSMVRQLLELCEQFEQSLRVIVVETPAAQAPKGQKHRQGQAKYGFAVGYIAAMLHVANPDIEQSYAAADDWTHGVPKAKRAAAVGQFFPALATDDKGHDCADAIALGHWWLTCEMMK